MIPKGSNPSTFKLLKKVGIVLFVTEALAFAGSYWVWNRLNTDRDFRFYINENYPIVLEYYYAFGEKVGSSEIRKIDSAYWTHVNTSQK